MSQGQTPQDPQILGYPGISWNIPEADTPKSPDTKYPRIPRMSQDICWDTHNVGATAPLVPVSYPPVEYPMNPLLNLVCGLS